MLNTKVSRLDQVESYSHLPILTEQSTYTKKNIEGVENKGMEIGSGAEILSSCNSNRQMNICRKDIKKVTSC